jgi:hypothetical protein
MSVIAIYQQLGVVWHGTLEATAKLIDNIPATSYDWEFVPEAGKTFTDTGSGTCH